MGSGKPGGGVQVQRQISSRLRTHGAAALTGPKAVGKTTTARTFAASEIRLDQDRAALAAAQTDPRLVLDGDNPRLIDEYQLAEGIWNAVRGRVDDLGVKGLFLLTGSATPEHDPVSHTGARRIAPVTMRTMPLFERRLSTGLVSVGDALEANSDYLQVIVEMDVRRVDNVRRDPAGVRRLLVSYARNTATDAALRTIGRTAEEPLREATLHEYVRVLKRLFLIEDQENWKPSLRSRVRLAATPKRHLADPSLAVAALGAAPERLLRSEIELAGFLFESQVIHDVRVYSQRHRAQVRFYRDNKGLEVDAIVEATDGRWAAIEAKLGHHRVDEGAHNLLAMRDKLADHIQEACGALVVVVADSPTYLRPDGVLVTSLASLGP